MRIEKRLSNSFKAFAASGKAGGTILILCTILSLMVANSPWGAPYLAFWQINLAGLSVELWINDALMAIFFLLIGLELQRELNNGELSDLRNALLPIIAAAGGVAVPALIHFTLNGGTHTQPGMGIPMATDIAFALGVLALLGSRVPASLKIFLTALAVMDDLAAIIVIAVFYTAELKVGYLLGALGMFVALFLMNRRLKVLALWPYLLGGAVMWFLMLMSGVHATIAGVLLAFTIPYSHTQDDPAGRFPDPADLRAGQYRHRDRRRLGRRTDVVEQPGHHRRPGRRQAGRHLPVHLCRRDARRVPLAARPGMAPRDRRRPLGRDRFHDVDLHHQPGVCR